MKHYFKLTTVLLLSTNLFLSSCKEEQQLPFEPAAYAVKFSIPQRPGATVGTNLSAIISLTKENGEAVITDKPYELLYNGKFSTPEIQVAKGNYKLVKLIIKNADGSVMFAAPLQGSAKANQVTKPLAITASIVTALTSIDLEVLPITPTDRSQDFGYTDGTFNEKPVEHAPTEFSITVHPLFSIGNVLYDSIPVSLKLTTYPVQGEPFTTIHALPAGSKKFTLSKNAAKYTLSISKWGMQDSSTILPTDMKDGITYWLGGTKAAKKLKYESVYRQSGNTWLADTRKEYLYGNNDRVNLINHFKKAADYSTILEMKEEIIYENNRVSQIKKSINNQNSFYTYQPDGKLAQLRYTDMEGQTIGLANYVTLPGGIGSSSNYSVSTVFESTKYYYKQHYTYEVHNGNVLKFNYATTHGDTETSLYEYDFGINPFIHLQLPELGFTSLSKNNVTKRYANYTTNIPKHTAYEYRYVYDADGYPIELYTKYRLTEGATEAFSTKTVFNYY